MTCNISDSLDSSDGPDTDLVILAWQPFGTNRLLTIKDSLKLLTASLSKLARDWKVATLKDHFPHYFYFGNITNTLTYIGPLPPYEAFEPKRTSQKDYLEMVELYRENNWSYLEVSKVYILNDCIALYEVLIKFFVTINSKFAMYPVQSISAPSCAFKIWRIEQLGLMMIPDFSSTPWDSYLRESYKGGIVDVYNFHLKGRGYYYDVNSLYPTAMLEDMPVGCPTILSSFNEKELPLAFFGYADVTVTSPSNEFLGLLSIKHKGRLISPKGTFRGLFFSEELRFALRNGYKIERIHQLIRFDREPIFRELILKLNEMKVNAQKNNQPTIRNLAKLLMNSMYGRFGMHTTPEQTAIVNKEESLIYEKIFTILSSIDFPSFSLIHYIYEGRLFGGDKRIESLFAHYKGSLKMNTNVAIASAVTAYSRLIINKLKLDVIELGLTIYYSDTDSLVVNDTLPSEYIDPATLGKLKLEHEIEEGIFALPKVYYLKTTEGEVFKAKGYSGRLTREQYLELIEGRPITDLRVNRWYRSLSDSTIQIRRNQPYEIKYLFNKRARLGNTTFPLNITTKSNSKNPPQ